MVEAEQNNRCLCIPYITVAGDVVVTGPLSAAENDAISDANCPTGTIGKNIHISFLLV